MLEVTFHGHACVQLDDGDHGIVIDPFFSGNPLAVARPDGFERLNAVLVTHGHQDHLGDAVDISKYYKAPIIAPFELAQFCQRRGASVHPMHIGGGYDFDFGSVRLTIAHHGSAFVDKGAEYTGNPCGFIVELGGRTVYHAGDTGLFMDMQLIGEMYDIDLAFLPIGDNFTMGPREAAKAVEFIKPRVVVPIHYGTFEVLEQTPDRFVELTSASESEVTVLKPGEKHTF